MADTNQEMNMLWEKWFRLEWDATRREFLGEERWQKLKEKEQEKGDIHGKNTRRKNSKV